jgi:hypothetical protein
MNSLETKLVKLGTDGAEGVLSYIYKPRWQNKSSATLAINYPKCCIKIVGVI